MADYISRDYAVENMENFPWDTEHDKNAAIHLVRELVPAADVRPVVREKWGLDPQCPVCGEDRYKGLDAEIWADWEPPFCPNCGADMRPYKVGRIGEKDNG